MTDHDLDAALVTVLKKLTAAQENKDIENAHGDADDALCDFLTALGYTEVVAAFDAVPKWYA